MIQSVLKGYQMIAMLISALPLPLSAFIGLMFALIAVLALVKSFTFLVGGGD